MNVFQVFVDKQTSIHPAGQLPLSRSDWDLSHPAWTCSEAPTAAARSCTSWFTLNLAVIQKVNRADLACWMTILQLGFGSRERQRHDGRKAKQGVEAVNCCIVNQLRFKEDQWAWRRRGGGGMEGWRPQRWNAASKSFAAAATKMVNGKKWSKTSICGILRRRTICLLMVSKWIPLEIFCFNFSSYLRKSCRFVQIKPSFQSSVVFCLFFKLQTCRGL